VPPGNRRAVGHRVEKRLAALGIRDLLQFLRQNINRIITKRSIHPPK
jgi:hypothetical protein